VLHTEDDTPQKERNGLVPTLGVDSVDWRVYTASACVVEDAVEATKCAHGRIDLGPNVLLVRDVRAGEEATPSSSSMRFLA